MATLNGIEFGILSKTTSIIHDNIITDIPGSDTVVVNDLGYSTEPMTITGHVKNETEFDNFKEQYYSGGALTLIIDTNSGKQYKVFALRNITELDGQRGYPLTDIIFNAFFHMQTPYLESILEVTRSKSITTQNQEWSADDDGIDIATLGNVDAVPDIVVTGGALGTSFTKDGYEHNDTDATEHSTTSTSYVLKKTYTYSADARIAYRLDTVGLDQKNVYGGPSYCYSKITYQAASLNGGAETDIQEWTTQSTSYVTRTNSPDIQAADNEDLVVNFYLKTTDGGLTMYMTNLVSTVQDMTAVGTKNVQIFNTADSTVKCDVSNEMNPDMIIRINADGTGTVDYDDDFTTTKYLDAYFLSGITHDAVNDELDIADDGYIIWKIDCKYPIRGIPTLTARINITAGTPTIQISTDAATWYDIDTAIVDDVETSYPLDNATSLSLAGKTVFYFRFDCVKAGAATCSVKYFELDINIHTVYAKNPKITKGGVASTFRCDQDTNSGLTCEVELAYRTRWWA